MRVSGVAEPGRWFRSALVSAGAAIAAAFWAIAWLELPPGGPPFMAALAVATAGYLAAVALLARNAVVPRGLLLRGPYA